ncbi:MAG: hypothetical protein CVV44_23005 [Spirochaetae bacterium HGW-Spirochaetae-1]|jgi:hypothetical protein|nr:MAG: hypothetical protein CVV44_23005 [Spirochaetae bacterium HGW-Spirochaetae-1]
MNVLLFGIILFVIPFGVQIVLWRRNIVSKTPKIIIAIFIFGFFLLGIINVLLTGYHLIYAGINLKYIYRLLHSYLIASSMFIAYLLTYTAIESDSPSGLILKKVEKYGMNGLPNNELKGILTNNNTVLERLEGLIRDKNVTKQNGRYVMTRNGRLLLYTILFLRSLFTSDEFRG